MTVFEVPTGMNVSITSDVSMNFLKTATYEEVWQSVTFRATATDQFQVDNHGVLRRLFVDTSIRMPNGDHTIWLSNVTHRKNDTGASSSETITPPCKALGISTEDE